jgi:nucleotide-binding universal stress UspA family protein
VLGTDEEALLGDVRARLEAEAHRLAGLTGVGVNPHLAAGSTVAALVAIAAYEQADLVLVGDAREGGRLLGTTAERTSRDAAAPVLVLRSAGRLDAWLAGGRPLRVLVGIDEGQASEAARAWAERLDRLGRCEVTLVHVCAPDEVHARLQLPPPQDEHSLSAEARAALEGAFARRHPAPAGWTRSIVAARGSPDAHLASLADRSDVDLVVVGQRHSSWLERLWSGSVGHGLLRSCPVSVATVPASVSGAAPVVRPPRVILVGTDFSAVAARALAQAAAMAPAGAELHVAHVLPPLTNPTDLAHQRAEAWRRLQVLPAGPGEGARPQHHVLDGDAAEQLLALAARCNAELLVLGTSQRGLSGLLGSVARSVSERAPVPVLLVPAGLA